jgi:hypothetical protein
MRRHPVEVAVVQGVIAEFVAGVEDPAAQRGIGAEPGADRQDGDPYAAGRDLIEEPADQCWIALPEERQRHSAAVRGP